MRTSIQYIALLLLVFSAQTTSWAKDLDNDSSSRFNHKDTDTALLLGAFAGFGFGQYYANDEWSFTSTTFAAADALLFLSVIPIALDYRPRGFDNLILFGVGIFLFGSRATQAVLAKYTLEKNQSKFSYNNRAPSEGLSDQRFHLTLFSATF